MAGSPFLLDEEEQDEENRRALAAGFALPGFAAVFDGIDPPAPQRQMAPRRARRTNVSYTQQAQPMYSPALMGAAAAMGPLAQGGALRSMIGGAMSAISDENDSRVAQAREWRRMQHELAMAEMRAQIEREKNALQQYQIDTDAASQIRQLRFQKAMADKKLGFHGPKTLVNGRWVEDWEL